MPGTPWPVRALNSDARSPGGRCHPSRQKAQRDCKCQSLQLRLTLCNPMDCSPPGSSVHGILQARRLEWVAMPFSRGSS